MIHHIGERFEQIKDMIDKRYHRSIEFRRLGDVTDGLDDVDYRSQGQDLIIPIKMKSSYLGTIVIPQGASLTEDDHQQISQLVRLILEPQLYRQYLSNIQEQQNEEQSPSVRWDAHPSVVSLFPKMEIQKDEDNFSSPTMYSIIYLKSYDDFRLLKAAKMLHDLTGRWAFVSWSDIKNNISDAQDIVKLGAMSIFCPYIQDLTETEQRCLAEYQEIKTRQNGETPLLILGGDQNLSSQEETTVVLDSRLIKKIIGQSLDLDRAPLSDADLQDVLEMLFFFPSMNR